MKIVIDHIVFFSINIAIVIRISDEPKAARQITLPELLHQRHWRYGFNAERAYYAGWGA
jgi:hypothetical protein